MEPVVVALDFETADNGADAACALGMARVRGSRVEDVFYRLIRPPRRRVWYTDIHGITWNMVKNCPSFGELWPECSAFLQGAVGLLRGSGRGSARRALSVHGAGGAQGTAFAPQPPQRCM